MRINTGFKSTNICSEMIVSAQFYINRQQNEEDEPGDNRIKNHAILKSSSDHAAENARRLAKIELCIPEVNLADWKIH